MSYTVKSNREVLQEWTNKKKSDGTDSKLSVKNIGDRNIREATARMLDNERYQYALLGEDSQGSNTLSNIGGQTDGSDDSDSYQFQPIALALTRRAFPELFAHQCVGVQPMNGPVGLAYALRKIYASNNSDNIEAAWDEVDKWGGYTGDQRQTSGTLSTESDGINDTSASGIAATSAETWTIDPAGSGTWPELNVKVDRKTIEAVTRKLATSYSLESAMDLKVMLGVELEREMVDTLQYELKAELDREIVYRMKKAATDTSKDGSTITAVDVSGTSIDGRWSQEKIANIINAIIYQSNYIRKRTREGSGNFVVVSPAIATMLQASPNGIFTGIGNEVTQYAGVAQIGTINNGMIKVYIDSYARTDYALVGYKGPTPKNAGIIYSPYLIGLTKRAIAQEDFSPRLGGIMRYAITDTLLGSGRYYRLIPFSNVSEVIPTA